MLNLRQATMRNVWIIAHREYMERIRTRGFLITTVMIPLIIAGFAFGTSFLAGRANNDLRIAVVTQDAQLANDLQAELHRQENTSKSEGGSPQAISAAKPTRITVVSLQPSGNGTKLLNEDLDSGRLDGYLSVASPAGSENRPAF